MDRTEFVKHRITATVQLLFVVLFALVVATGAQSQKKLTSRILLIPLDDRPPCLQMPVKMGLIGDGEVVAPPRAMLGRFTEFGKSDEIVKWIRKQDLRSFDAAIVSVDMLAYGGLVAMREYETTVETALRRLEIVRTIRRSAPRMPIYGSSVIMRLAPTGNVVNESYRVNLARWAEISPDPAKAAETAELEKKIPVDALEKYKKARERDLKINQFAVDLVREKVFDYLILSQDDAKPNGVHIADREKLIAYVESKKLGDRVAVQPGADEVSMLLLSRALTAKYKYHPKIKAIYSDEKLADQFMPYEDRPLRKTVSFHIKAAGGVEVADEEDAEILFFVFVSRFEKGAAERFVERILSAKPDYRGRRVIVADVDPKGEIQGGDIAFTDEMLRSLLPGKLYGYASWNTAGNTIGTALPHGLIFSAAVAEFEFSGRKWKSTPTEFKRRDAVMRRSVESQHWFVLNRLFDDYLYHSVVRPKAIAFAREKGWNVFRFNKTETEQVEDFGAKEMLSRIPAILRQVAVPPRGGAVCREDPKRFSFQLPWGRTFEAEIDFDLDCEAVKLR
jgi:hypothetical protein